MKKVKNLVLFMLAIMTIVSCFAIPASAVGNYSDTEYDTNLQTSAAPDTFRLASKPVIENGVYSPYGRRLKLDATATYVYNKEGSSFMFIVVGYTSINSISGYPNDTRNPGRIDVGQRRFLRQWVYENGHGYCGLYAASIYANSYSKGLWSPDSIGSYPYAND